jgi:hypothetical protein
LLPWSVAIRSSSRRATVICDNALEPHDQCELFIGRRSKDGRGAKFAEHGFECPRSESSRALMDEPQLKDNRRAEASDFAQRNFFSG